MKPSPDDFDLDVDVEALDSTQAPTHVYTPPRRPYRLVGGSVVVTTLLVGVLAWSMRHAESRPAPPAPTVVAPPVAAASAATPASPSIPPPSPVLAITPPARTGEIALPKPRRVPELLTLTLAELRPSAALQPVRLAAALGDGVSVLNLWATYCEPCLRELPAFRTLAERDRWGRDVRFVPVLVDRLQPDDPTQTATLERLRAVTTNHRLLLDPADDLSAALRAAAIHDGPAVLPVTLVFQCDELAWAHLGELDPPLLSAVVQRLRRAPRCVGSERAVPPLATDAVSPPPPAAPAESPHCGDGKCDRTRNETCATCRADCSCPTGTLCILNASGATHCARDEAALKD